MRKGNGPSRAVISRSFFRCSSNDPKKEKKKGGGKIEEEMNEIEHDTRVIVRDNQPRSLRRQLPAVIRLGCCRIALAFARTEASPKSFIHAIKFAFKNSASSLRWRHFDSLLFKLPVPFERSTIPPEDLDSVGARVRHQTFMQISFRRRDFSRILPRTSSKPSKFHPDSPLAPTSVGYSIARHVARL